MSEPTAPVDPFAPAQDPNAPAEDTTTTPDKPAPDYSKLKPGDKVPVPEGYSTYTGPPFDDNPTKLPEPKAQDEPAEAPSDQPA